MFLRCRHKNVLSFFANHALTGYVDSALILGAKVTKGRTPRGDFEYTATGANYTGFSNEESMPISRGILIKPPDLRPDGSRIIGLDLARLIACLGVIWFHTGYSVYNTLGYFRMPFYAALLAYLVATSLTGNKRRSWGQFTSHRAMRLLVPFVIWMVLYRIPNIAKGHLTLPITFNNLIAGMGAVHLWFLPFAFVASMLAYALVSAVGAGRTGLRLALAICLVPLGILWTTAPLALGENGNIVDMWTPLFGSVFLGTAIALLQQWQAFAKFVRSQWLVWLLLWPVCILLSLLESNWAGNIFGTLAGVFLMMAGISAPLRGSPAFWKYVGQLCYGMYLTHFVFVMALERAKVTWEGSASLRFAIILVGSASSAVLLQQLPGGRFLLGMEPESKKPQSQKERGLSPVPRVPALSAASV
jgi:peptidoglycan/LPS O-acetylase OafA/YrhL